MSPRRHSAPLVALVILLLAAPAASSGPHAGMTFLDNGRVRVGVDLDDGARIAFLAPSAGPRSGVNLVAGAEPAYSHAAADGGAVLTSSNTGNELYTKVVPLTGAGSPCECTLEQWLTLNGGAVRVRTRLTNFLSDASRPAPAWNELPALYTLDGAHRLVTYTGSAPYTRARLREYTAADGGVFYVRPGPSFAATEHWAALVDDSGFGVGLLNREVTGFAGIAGRAGGQGVNGYVAAASRELLDANATFAFEYRLVVGTVGQIRDDAYRHRVDDRPDYRFTSDRRHFTYAYADDKGFPVRGALRVVPTTDDPQLLGPEQWWAARRVPRLYVRGRWAVEHAAWAQVYWGPAWSEARSLSFHVRNDGRFHSYQVDLFQDPTYRGTIRGLRIDPTELAEPDGVIDITCVSWRPCPVDRKAEARLLGNDLVPFLEDFSAPLDPHVWQVSRAGVGPAARVADGRLELSFPGTSVADEPNTWLGISLETRCRLTGDYDLQVDFRLLSWPERSGVTANFGVNYDRQLFRQSFDDELLGAWFDPGWAGIPYTGATGSFRLVRLGSSIAGYYRRDGSWVRVLVAPVTREDAFAHLSLWTETRQFARRDVVVAFDNFRVNRGRMRCP